MIKNPITPVQRGRLPAFVRSEYPAFEAYMMKYFQWLEQDDNFVGVLEQWKYNTDASNQVEPYVDAILRDLGWTWTGELAVEKRVLLATLRDFYLSRGTKKSFAWLFRTLFDQPVEIRYPREQMLIPSQADYATLAKLFFSADSRESQAFLDILEALDNRDHVEIVGMGSGTLCTVESMQIVLSGGRAYVQAEIIEPLTDFIVGEDIQVRSATAVIVEKLKNVLEFQIENPGDSFSPQDVVEVEGAELQGVVRVASVEGGRVATIQIDNPGTGYAVGDALTAVKRADDYGFGLFAVISEVDVDGKIVAIEIRNRGRGYKILPEINIRTATGGGAKLRATTTDIGAIKRLETIQPYVDFNESTVVATAGNAVIACKSATVFRSKEYRDRIGVLGENSVLIDSDRYQQFSYDMVSAVPSKYQSAIVDELLHPVGYVRTSVLGITESAIVDIEVETAVDIQGVPALTYITTLGGLPIATLSGKNLITK